MAFYPIFINIKDKPVLVVGGGSIACRKVQTLLEFGAFVRIVSPQVIPELRQLINEGNCQWRKKVYAKEDIEDAVLVFSCTEKEEINAQVALDAEAENRLINVADDPQKCSFIVPSIMRRGDLSIAVSTGGSSPMAARIIREELEEIYGDEIKVYLDLLRNWRERVKTNLPAEKRRQFWEKATEGQVLALIKKGQMQQAEEVMEKCFQSLSD